ENLGARQRELNRAAGTKPRGDEVEPRQVIEAMSLDEELGKALRQDALEHSVSRQTGRVERRKACGCRRTIAIQCVDRLRELPFPPVGLRLDEVHLAL